MLVGMPDARHYGAAEKALIAAGGLFLPGVYSVVGKCDIHLSTTKKRRAARRIRKKNQVARHLSVRSFCRIN